MNRLYTENFGDQVLNKIVIEGIPYLRFLGIRLEVQADELTLMLPYNKHFVGNPDIPALHGGVTASLLEITATVDLCLKRLVMGINTGSKPIETQEIVLPKTISFSVDYLRGGAPKDSFARAKINRMGRRYASVQVEAWQEERTRLFAQGTGHFLLV